MLRVLVLSLAAMAGAPTDSVGETFNLAIGERWSAPEGGVALTLRSLSPDSGCLSATDCSQMTFDGSVVIEREGHDASLSKIQALLLQDAALELPFEGGRFELLGVKVDGGIARALFRRVTEAPRPRTYVEWDAAKRLIADKEFLSANAQREGVRTTKSGLQYEVIDSGSSDRVEPGRTFFIEYSASFTDGTSAHIFDESSDEMPMELSEADALPGLKEGLQLMTEGAHYRFFLRPSLALGAKGGRPTYFSIEAPPDAALIFDVKVSVIW